MADRAYTRDGDNEAVVDFTPVGPTVRVKSTGGASARSGDSTGTITITQGSADIVGSGTAFAAGHVGMALSPTGRYDIAAIITAVTDATHLTVNKTYHEIVGEGLTYEITLVPHTRYRMIADANCTVRLGGSSVVAIEQDDLKSTDMPVRAWVEMSVYTGDKDVYAAVIPYTGVDDVRLFLTKLGKR